MWAGKLKAFLKPSTSRTLLAMLITAYAVTQGVGWCDTIVFLGRTGSIGPYMWFEPCLWPFMPLLKHLYMKLAAWEGLHIKHIYVTWFNACLGLHLIWEFPGPLSPTAMMVVVPIHIPYWYVLSCLIVTISKGVWMLLKAAGTRIARKVEASRR